ncbi:hypothetical protein HanRHA438_Chr10g0458841 [Helianthus annuus]|nr:hypothetical protein HanRHA438_Chr10g0458841 [Helianthus annuus]
MSAGTPAPSISDKPPKNPPSSFLSVHRRLLRHTPPSSFSAFYRQPHPTTTSSLFFPDTSSGGAASVVSAASMKRVSPFYSVSFLHLLLFRSV